jgi:glyoxylase-like metal-dependent hydrolase (beta-lactamase superfamily II)
MSHYIAQGVLRVATGISNAYLVGTQKRWVLVDSGTAGYCDKIVGAAEGEFGENNRPKAILLTHGHFDHAGSAAELSDYWDVPIYAHRMELPYLQGKSKYPPPDPTVGGFMSQLSRFFPNIAYDFGDRVRELRVDKLPGLEGWTCIETPGHTPGHVSFFREEDGTLLAGDAFTTLDQDSMVNTVTRRPKVSRPPAYYTIDWQQAEDSVKRLAALHPRTLATGHGLPMSGPRASNQLRELARNFPAPRHGRYVEEPARADKSGIVYTPPPPPGSAWPKIAAAAGIAAAVVIAARKLEGRRGNPKRGQDSGRAA